MNPYSQVFFEIVLLIVGVGVLIWLAATYGFIVALIGFFILFLI